MVGHVDVLPHVGDRLPTSRVGLRTHCGTGKSSSHVDSDSSPDSRSDSHAFYLRAVAQRYTYGQTQPHGVMEHGWQPVDQSGLDT